ncbi:helix-turn-helix transcriptional regulator [Bacillus infantis]|uniref:helix-turn-helix transcriptional regulator n=1 Tax=Bacillus infantis TaxID=324767 RepID=UPI003CEE38EB
MKESAKPVFDLASRTADMLVAMFGKRCEVAVHDFSSLKNSLVYIAGDLTGRQIGSPITDLVLNELAKKKDKVDDIPNYRTQTKKGAILKSSTIFLRDGENHVVGALCINYDISLFMQFGGEIEDFISIHSGETKEENFYSSVQDVIHGMVEQVLNGLKKSPSIMQLEEKVECVRQLEEKGAFLIKGATDYVANVLGVSKFTVYNYLQKIRTESEFQKQ